MSIEKMREEFEAAYVKEMVRRHGEGFRSSAVHSIKMDSPMVEIALWAWQASRAAIEVELPEHFEYDNPGEVFPAIKDCRKAIEDAGLKVSQ